MTRSLKLFFIFFSFLFFFLTEGVYAQKKCDCPEFDALNVKRESQKEILLTAEKLNRSSNVICNAKAYELLAEEFISKRQYDSATFYLQNAISVYAKNDCNSSVNKRAYTFLSDVSNNVGDYALSLEYSLKLLPIVEKDGHKNEEADCLLTIALSFHRMKQSEKGMQYARDAVSKINLTPPSIEKANLLYRISARYLWYYQDTKNITVLDSAENFTKEQLQIGREFNDNNILRKGFNQLNGYAHERKDYKRALQYLDSSFLYTKKTDNESLLATNYGDRADVLMEMGNYVEARRFADSCLAIHQRFKNPGTIANAYALIYQVSERSGNYKDALWALNNYVEINDSLTKVERTMAINELEKKYNQAKNEKTINELAQERKIYLLLAVAGLLSLIAIGFFIRQQSLKSKQKILETEQRLNRARMNPHFFFNALTSLQSFAMRENDGKAIAFNLSKFSHIMRETLESSYKEYVTIEQEIDFLNEYLSLQQIRFPNKFSYNISASEDIETYELNIPSMIIQPFVENSIEHGFSDIDYEGDISISFTKERDEVLITINDNGKGLAISYEGQELSQKEDSNHISRASQIIKDRIYLLNIKLKTKARFTIMNNNIGKGVIVKIYLPTILK